jgi:hypothetical protein
MEGSGHMKNKAEINEQEKMMESFYRYISYRHSENVAKEFDEIRELAKDVEYPKELDDWFNDYLKKSKKAEMKRKRIDTMKRIASRVAIVAICLGFGLAVITASVDAFRIRFLNFLTDVTQRYTSLQVEEIKGKEDIFTINWSNYFLPEYVIGGYSINRIQEFGNNKMIFYQNSRGDEIQFSQSPNSNNYQIDTENADTTEIIINDTKGILVDKNGLITLLWYNTDNTFFLIGKTDKEEIVRMAESVKLIKE